MSKSFKAVNPPPTNLIKPNTSLTGRTEYLSWINGSLQMNLAKIEELCSGAVYCQFMHVLFPNSITLKRVRWNANVEHQYIDNFKVLQKCFSDLEVKKKIPLEKLCKGNFMENYEFLVWFKVFYDANFVEWPVAYNANEEREKASLSRSSTLSKTPDCYYTSADKLTPTRDTRSASPITASYNMGAGDNPLREKLIEAKDKSKELTIKINSLENEKRNLNTELMHSEARFNSMSITMDAVKQYCMDNAEEDSGHLSAVLSILSQQMEQMEQTHPSATTAPDQTV